MCYELLLPTLGLSLRVWGLELVLNCCCHIVEFLLLTLGRLHYSQRSFSLPFFLQHLRFSKCRLRFFGFSFEDEYSIVEMIGPLDAHKGDTCYVLCITLELANVID